MSETLWSKLLEAVKYLERHHITALKETRRMALTLLQNPEQGLPCQYLCNSLLVDEQDIPAEARNIRELIIAVATRLGFPDARAAIEIQQLPGEHGGALRLVLHDKHARPANLFSLRQSARRVKRALADAEQALQQIELELGAA